ncbi:MAG TPA: flavin reductase family protein [Candidatus Cloacimonetes bacterium]|nr:flavin reductase family protein [Candidatus Cloacimonadota bacterium]
MERVKYNEAIKKIKNPAKIAIAVVKDKNGKANLITLEWYMRTSIKPPMLAISIGHTRYSYECLQNFRYFNLCFPSREMNNETLLCGTKSGRDTDKLQVTKLEWFKGRLAQLPIIKDAVANFECEVVTQVRSGDHTIFVGEVKHSWVNEGKEVLLFQDLG